jgi:hypothetical protein
MTIPPFVMPCIPTRAVKPPAGPGWVHEIKHDGYRLQVVGDKSAPVHPPRVRCPSSQVWVTLMTKSATNDLSSTIDGMSISMAT